ncbi:alpha tubulin suppressor [Coemansia sp. Benny D115]|nr:alpha tubulin suppressor [Coemansia sp. Benny D115]
MPRILALGSNSSGQLATGGTEDVHCFTHTLVSDGLIGDSALASNTSGDTKWHVVGGGNHAFAWPADGSKLYGCGSNSDGELAMGDLPDRIPAVKWTAIDGVPGAVRQISCGWNHSLLLDTQGQVYAAGSNSFGQLGSTLKRQSVWMPVASSHVGKRFVAVACGLRHSLALAEDGSVYGWGANRSGQLGIGGSQKTVSCVSWVSEGLPPMCMVACGRSHSVLLSADRLSVYVCGQDKYGQLGPRNAQDGAKCGLWRRFQLPQRAVKLCSGWEFGAALLEHAEGDGGDSTVAMWGRADHGQLGVGKDDDALEALSAGELALIKFDTRVVDIACGSNHTVVLTEEGDVHLWGWNEHGNAGDASLNDVWRPLKVQIQHTDSMRVWRVGCGYGNSYLVISGESAD